MEVKRIPSETGKKPVENRSDKWMPAPRNRPFFNMGTLRDGEPKVSPYSGGHGVGFQAKDIEQNGKKPVREGHYDSMLETVGMIGKLTPEQQADPKIMELAKNLLEKMELILEAKQPKSP